MSAADLEQVADELYSLPLGEFTPTRNARAKEVRAAGDRELAAEVARLPKPSVAAWAANTLVRERTEQVGEVLSLGAMLREAQEDLDPAALRTLTQQRRQLVAALGREAARIAAGRGQQLSPAVVEELEHTLQAAMTDEAAADALRTGRLLRSLSGTGLEDVDLTDAVALPGGTPAPRSKARAGSPPDELAAARERRRKAGTDEDAERERRERERAERDEAQREVARLRGEADEADTAAGRADRVLRDVERRREEARRRREELRGDLRRLKAELAELEQDLGEVEDKLEGLDTERDEASRAADRARLAADRLQEELRRAEERLRSP